MGFETELHVIGFQRRVTSYSILKIVVDKEEGCSDEVEKCWNSEVKFRIPNSNVNFL